MTEDNKLKAKAIATGVFVACSAALFGASNFLTWDSWS